MKAEAIVYAARGVGLDIIAEMVERAEETVREWRFLDHIVTGYIDEKCIFFHHIECIMVK